MSAVGIFAGRGDTIVAMMLALVIDIWIGYQVHKFVAWCKRQ